MAYVSYSSVATQQPKPSFPSFFSFITFLYLKELFSKLSFQNTFVFALRFEPTYNISQQDNNILHFPVIVALPDGR